MTRQMLAPIALTCGEPGGVGPELAVAARAALPDLDMVWIGDPRHLPKGSAYQLVDAPHQSSEVPAGVLPVLAHPFAAENPPGVLVPDNARGVIEVIERAVGLAMSGAVAAVCTAPLHKKALKDGAGFAFPGHTEFLAHLAGVERVVMMLASPLLRVVPVTIHIPLSDVAAALTTELLEETIRVTHAGLIRDCGLARPRIAVAGLNPHAGEGGAMGDEETRIITPVLDRLRAEGMAIVGPMSADTMFHARARAGYDVAVCMYHDQALIPIKTLDFDGGVNVTLGLPFIRTSPDHGTACDIAGRGLARPDSMIAALRLARDMALARQAG
jgi:4-hydroxythreonine-4-phosphate dehydrogenase